MFLSNLSHSFSPVVMNIHDSVTWVGRFYLAGTGRVPYASSRVQ